MGAFFVYICTKSDIMELINFFFGNPIHFLFLFLYTSILFVGIWVTIFMIRKKLL